MIGKQSKYAFCNAQISMHQSKRLCTKVMHSVPRVTTPLITYCVDLYVHTIGHRNCNIQSWCVAMVNICMCIPCAMLCTWHMACTYRSTLISIVVWWLLNHPVEQWTILQYYSTLLWVTCSTERHCNWWQISNCAHTELQTDVDNLHGILHRQAGLSCSWAKENTVLASVGPTALAAIVRNLQQASGSSYRFWTAGGLTVTPHVTHIQ